MDAPTLRRGLFGYRRKDVRAILTDRDVMIVRASKEAREAEAKVAEQAAELERTSREIVELNTRNHDPSPGSASPRSGSAPSSAPARPPRPRG
jgi:hypothetical protein